MGSLVGGWVRKVENKAKLSPAVAGAWLSLAKRDLQDKIKPLCTRYSLQLKLDHFLEVGDFGFSLKVGFLSR